MAIATKCKKKHPRLDEAFLFVDSLQISKPKLPVLFRNQSCQILYQVVMGKQRNQPSAERSMHSKQSGTKGIDNRHELESCTQSKRETVEKSWIRCLQSPVDVNTVTRFNSIKICANPSRLRSQLKVR